MPATSLSFIWAMVAVITALLMLTITIIAAVMVHGRKIRDAERKFQLLFEKVFETVILIDEGLHIENINESSGKMLGYSKEGLLGRSIGLLVAEDNWPILQVEFTKSLKSGLDFFGETRLLTRDKKIVLAEAGGTVLKFGGNSHLLISLRDIGARKKAALELSEKNAALKELMIHLEDEKMKFKNQIAKVVDEVLLPAVSKLRNRDGTISETHRDVLRDALEELASVSGGTVFTYGRLTPREVEIANMLKSGAGSKEIADVLKISTATVNKHRERIRKKLAINKKDVNLTSFLNNSME